MEICFVPLAVLFIAGVLDYSKLKIPDVLSGFLWVFVFFLCPPASLYWMAGSFAVILFLHSILVMLKHPIAGWGDILIAPPYFGLMASLSLNPLFSLIAFVGWFLNMARVKKEVALSPYLFAGYALGLLLQFLPAYISPNLFSIGN